MATLYEYFKLDFPNALGQPSELEISSADPVFKIESNVGVEINSNSKFVAYYVPQFTNMLKVCYSLIQITPSVIETSKHVIIVSSLPGDVNLGILGTENSVFSNRIYIYMETDLNGDELDLLNEYAKLNSFHVTLRSRNYVMKKMSIERPLAFISHDSRDKIEIAHPVAIGLTKLMCPVWYDEFSLKAGDHLRESIERGLKETKKCILILSKNFFSNDGWTRIEFDTVFTRENLEKSSVIIPIWYNISEKDVYDYSPSLLNRLGLDWSKLGKDSVIRKLYTAVNN